VNAEQTSFIGSGTICVALNAKWNLNGQDQRAGANTGKGDLIKTPTLIKKIGSIKEPPNETKIHRKSEDPTES